MLANLYNKHIYIFTIKFSIQNHLLCVKTEQLFTGIVIAFCSSSTVIGLQLTSTPSLQKLEKLFKGIDKGIFFKIGPGQNLHHLIYIDIYIDDLIQEFRLAAATDNAVGV